MATGGESSSRIVPVACGSASVAFTGAERFTKNDSWPSASVSPRTGTLMKFVAVPAAKFSVPEVVV
jgi:hypothetical protein